MNRVQQSVALVFGVLVLALLGILLAGQQRVAVFQTQTLSGGVTKFSGVHVVQPTEAASATPALMADSSSANSVLFEVRDSATPVFAVYQAGVINGQVLSYGSTGQKIVCGSTEITGTGNIPTTLSTPVYVVVSQGEDAVGDMPARLTFTNSAATVTVKSWTSALTPAASSGAATVNWCAIGTP